VTAKARQLGRVVVRSDALAEMKERAQLALPRETGGILLGWRVDGEIHVRDAPSVIDPNASGLAYERRHREAEEILKRVLASEVSQSAVGYVGEWHTHPVLTPPSRRDYRAMRKIASRSPGRIALVVLAFDSKTGDWSATGAAILEHRRLIDAELIVE
jgi:hypothetical protein